MTQPTTRAGQRLLDWLRVGRDTGLYPPLETAPEAIVAIEAEVRTEIAEKVRALPTNVIQGKYPSVANNIDRRAILALLEETPMTRNQADLQALSDAATSIEIAACEALGEAVEATPWPPEPTADVGETRTGHGAVIAAVLWRKGWQIVRAATPVVPAGGLREALAWRAADDAAS